jgi:membrane-bound lytic murein transglycosylase A
MRDLAKIWLTGWLSCSYLGGWLMVSAIAKEAVNPLRLQSQQQLSTPECDLNCVGLDVRLWKQGSQPGDYKALLGSIDHSLRYLNTPEAAKAYQSYSVPGVTRDRVQRSLRRFRQLLLGAKSPQQLQQAVQREFQFYQSVGKDGQGRVEYTGYFQPSYAASRTPTAEFRYPLYRLPPGFSAWPQPHPTRMELEGNNGQKGSQGKLKGLELVWLRDRLEAYLVQVQGSARLRLTTGKSMTIGFAGRTQHPYTSLGKELIKDGKVPAENLQLPTVLAYFKAHPEALNVYIPRNRSFVFFQETFNSPPIGSLNVPVTAERSIATDKTIFPPGALALIQTQIPVRDRQGQFQAQFVNRFVLDHDTGSAIKGPGRVDIFMGTGSQAGDRAGLINTAGRLYYLLLK